MTGAFWIYVEAFHFLRPWMFLAAPPVLWMWWRLRRTRSGGGPEAAWMAPHLVQALTVPGATRGRLRPIDVIAGVMCLLIAAAAGPSWTRAPAPFAAQTAPLVIVMQVTPSMAATDVAPSRLARAKQKAMDLLALRSGARTALVAFAGSAHVAVPMSEDPGVMRPYLEGLSAEVMPIEGRDVTRAFDKAAALLAREATAGGVVFLVDDLSAADVSALQSAWRAQDSVASLGFLYLLPAGSAVPKGPDSSTGYLVTPDGRDVALLERALASAYQRAQLAESEQPWQDRGAWLVWPALCVMLLWFRRGMAVRWSQDGVGSWLFVSVALGLLLSPDTARAEGWRDWFLTPDQQGWLAFERKDYDLAAARFADPYLRGVALYRGGQYAAAAQEMAQIDSAEAAFLQGMAHLKSRGYRDGVRAFERALQLDPDHSAAQHNLPVAQQIVAYVEETRAQSDTGEDSGIGADDVVFDNESGRGQDTQIEADQDAGIPRLSTDQWMRTVDTRTSDFLRQRFRLEAAQATEDAQTQGSDPTAAQEETE